MGKSIVDLAREMRDSFEHVLTPDSTDCYWRLKDDSPSWMQGVCRKAHDNSRMLPDNYRYDYITDSIYLLADAEDDADYDELTSMNEWEEATNNSDLINWVGSHGWRPGYCDEAMREFGPGMDFMGIIGAGQIKEKEEVYSQVLDALDAVADSQDE